MGGSVSTLKRKFGGKRLHLLPFRSGGKTGCGDDKAGQGELAEIQGHFQELRG
jgi:hypothetical protein